MITIEVLIEKAKAGDKEAFNELFDSVNSYLLMCARQRISNEEDAKDVVQTTFYNALSGFDTLHKAKSFKAWITSILINACKDFYKHKKNEDSLEEAEVNYYRFYGDYDTVHLKLILEQFIKKLNESERETYELNKIYGYTATQISDALGENLNTIKSRLKRVNDKFEIFKRSLIIALAFILCTSIIGGVIAGYLENILNFFNIKTVGKNNDGLLNAIFEKDWVQNVYMDYIDLGNGYKITVSQLVIDEMNLYIVFDLQSEKDISKFNEFTITDLKIEDENNNLICYRKSILVDQYSKQIGDKVIKRSNHHLKCLVYMYSYEFPVSKLLDISFSKIVLSKKTILKNNNYLYIDSNVNFRINVDEKFINRSSIYYTCNNDAIKKSGITETGFYSIVHFNTAKKINKAKLIDSSGKSYKCEFCSLSIKDSTDYEYMFISEFDNKSSDSLTLVIGKEKFNLKQVGLEKP